MKAYCVTSSPYTQWGHRLEREEGRAGERPVSGYRRGFSMRGEFCFRLSSSTRFVAPWTAGRLSSVVFVGGIDEVFVPETLLIRPDISLRRRRLRFRFGLIHSDAGSGRLNSVIRRRLPESIGLRRPSEQGDTNKQIVIYDAVKRTAINIVKHPLVANRCRSNNRCWYE